MDDVDDHLDNIQGLTRICARDDGMEPITLTVSHNSSVAVDALYPTAPITLWVVIADVSPFLDAASDSC
jgi:hypothetical protein